MNESIHHRKPYSLRRFIGRHRPNERAQDEMKEVSRLLRREGFTVLPEHEGMQLY